jgi:hypothetical protein
MKYWSYPKYKSKFASTTEYYEAIVEEEENIDIDFPDP